MSLPKITQPLSELTIPSTKKRIKVRPMLVKEEKILLMAKKSENASDMLSAIKQVVNNCIIDDISLSKLANFDIEYLFLKIRAISISNIVELIMRQDEGGGQLKLIVDLDDVEVLFPEGVDNKIDISDDTFIVMKYPPASLYDDERLRDPEIDADKIFDIVIASCIDKIYQGDVAYDGSTATVDEILEFIENNVSPNEYAKIRKFIDNTPRLYHKIEYKDLKGETQVLELNSLTDFFTF